MGGAVRRRGREAGQAMVELAVIAGLLLMLFLAVWYLGKFHDVQASTIQAARYAAWERTVHAPSHMADARLEQQTRARLFTWNDGPFKAADGKRDGDAWGTQHALWREHRGARTLVAAPRDVLVSTSAGPLPGTAASGMSGLIESVSGFMGSVTGGEKLPQGGLQSSQVTVRLNKLASLPAPLNALDLSLTERAALVIDSWDASGPRQAASRTRAFAPASVLARADALLAPLRLVISPLEPAFLEFKPGRICPDIVPADRVSGGSKLPAYGGAAPCF